MRLHETHGKEKKIPAVSVNQISAIQHVVSLVTHLSKEIYSSNNHLSSLQAITEFEIIFYYVVSNNGIHVNLFKVEELFCARRQRSLRLL
jgi:hypothetical protein